MLRALNRKCGFEARLQRRELGRGGFAPCGRRRRRSLDGCMAKQRPGRVHDRPRSDSDQDQIDGGANDRKRPFDAEQHAHDHQHHGAAERDPGSKSERRKRDQHLIDRRLVPPYPATPRDIVQRPLEPVSDAEQGGAAAAQQGAEELRDARNAAAV